MSKLIFVVVIALVSAVFSAGAHALPTYYRIVDLGPQSMANAINSSGQVVGFDTSSGKGVATTWDAETGQKQAIPNPNWPMGGINHYWAYGNNNSGTVVGKFLNIYGLEHGYVYTSGSELQQLPVSGAAVGYKYNYSSANAINNSGIIVGEVAVQSYNARSAFIYDSVNGTTRILDQNAVLLDEGTGRMLAKSQQFGVTVSDNGLVAGYSYNNYSDSMAWVFDMTTGGITTLGSLSKFGCIETDCSQATYKQSAPTDINNKGQVVGWSEKYVNNELERRAFIWDAGAGMIDLGSLGDGSNQGSYAFGINDKGQVVGQTDVAGSFRPHAFLWENGEMIDLNTLLGADSPWSYLESARGINERGDIIGRGYFSDGTLHEFAIIATPEPSSFLLLGMGLAGAALLRKRLKK